MHRAWRLRAPGGSTKRMSAIAQRLVTRWYDDRPAPLWLLPLEALFRAVVVARRWAYAHGVLPSVRLPAPVVIVGNLTLGGTGKTPLVLWLAQALLRRGRHPGIALRGYGAAAARGIARVPAAGDAAQFGDEAVMLARRSGVPVAVGADRVGAARLLLQDGVDFVLADDGLQHYRLQRDVEIAVVDSRRAFGNGHCLPAGPLREPPARLARVDAIVVQDSGAGPPPLGRESLSMRLQVTGAVALMGGAERPLADFAGQRVHAIAGIGHPERFFDSLRAAGLQPIGHPHPDHAPLRCSDVEFGDELPVLMTEKDAVKCTGFAGPQHWYVRVDAQLSESDAQRLLAIVMRAAAGDRG
jgi:tetraacyldisaccharide 4'-kinase